MSTIASMPSSLILAALLYRLRTTGWPYVDLNRLIQVYEKFQSDTGMLIYGSYFDHSRQAIRRELEGDLKDLEMRRLIQRTVSRIQLTGPGIPSVKTLRVPVTHKRLADAADALFPPKVTP